MAPLQAISLLVTRLLRMAQEDRLVEEKAPVEEKMSLGSAGCVSRVVDRDME